MGWRNLRGILSRSQYLWGELANDLGKDEGGVNHASSIVPMIEVRFNHSERQNLSQVFFLQHQICLPSLVCLKNFLPLPLGALGLANPHKSSFLLFTL